MASGCGVEVYAEKIPVLDIARKILPKLSIDPLGAIASGSLVVCCEEKSAQAILHAWADEGIEGSLIGRVTPGPQTVLVEKGVSRPLPEFATDEITKIFSS